MLVVETPRVVADHNMNLPVITNVSDIAADMELIMYVAKPKSKSKAITKEAPPPRKRARIGETDSALAGKDAETDSALARIGEPRKPAPA